MSRLDRVVTIGAAEIRNSELAMWYSQERVTKKIWRDISDKWREICEDSFEPLFVGLGNGEAHVLVWGEGLMSKKDDNGKSISWLVDIEELANPK